MSLIQSMLNEFMPCGGSVCRGCEVECAHGGHINGGRTPDVNSMADALIEARKDVKKMHELLAVAFFEGWDCGNAELASAVAALTQGDA
jgi:hypothetical protein